MIYLLLTWFIAPVWWLVARLKHRSPPRRIAVIQVAKIGDMLCATPAVSALKVRYPEAELTVVHAPVTRALIARHPQVDATLEIDPRSWKGWTGKFHLARRLAGQNFDMALCLSPSLPLLLAMCWARIPLRYSLLPTGKNRTYQWLRPLLSDGEWHLSGELVLDAASRLLARHGVCMGRQKSMAEDATGEVVCDVLGIDAEPPAIGIAVSSANKLKELGETKLVALIEGLLERYPERIVLLGGPEDGESAARVLTQLTQSHRVVDATGKFKLDQLPALMRRLRLFIGVDSGLTYLADTFNVPIVSVVGPTDPREQRALGSNAHLIIERPRCYPCAFVFKAPYECKTGTRECVENVKVERILEVVEGVYNL